MSNLYDLVDDVLKEECWRLEDARSLCALFKARLALYLHPCLWNYSKCRFVRQIRNLLFIFKECASKSDFDRSGMREFVIYLIFLCYGWDIDESELVSESLQYLYKVHGNFTLLYQSTISEVLLHLGFVSFPEELVHRHHLCYFAHHASKTKALFDGIPFVDVGVPYISSGVLVDDQHRPTPLWFNGMVGNASVMKILIQHGASLTRPTNSPQSVAYFVMKLIDRAAEDLKVVIPEGEISMYDLYKISFISSRVRSDLQCVDVLLKAFSPLQLSRIRIASLRNLSTYFDNEIDFVKTMSDERFVPMLKYSFKEPPSLKHLSRIAVREMLHRNRELPFGIYTLNIDSELKCYLRLDDI